MNTTATYRAQCRTFKIFKEMSGLSGNVATSLEHPIAKLRLLPNCRDADSLALRKLVADLVRGQK
jgi:hypothetical protein